MILIVIVVKIVTYFIRNCSKYLFLFETAKISKMSPILSLLNYDLEIEVAVPFDEKQLVLDVKNSIEEFNDYTVIKENMGISFHFRDCNHCSVCAGCSCFWNVRWSSRLGTLICKENYYPHVRILFQIHLSK